VVAPGVAPAGAPSGRCRAARGGLAGRGGGAGAVLPFLGAVLRYLVARSRVARYGGDPATSFGRRPRLGPSAMTSYAFRLLNVFAESCFGGNPLCVFEDARGLRDEEMQALALQFNLSETTFILPGGDGADARVRVFTPDAEMRFA